MPGREVRRNKRDASHGKTPSTSLKGVAGRSVKAWKNPEEKQKRGFPEPKLGGNPQGKYERDLPGIPQGTRPEGPDS